MTKQWQCESCDFSIEGDREKEVVDRAMHHMRKAHPDKEITASDIKLSVANL